MQVPQRCCFIHIVLSIVLDLGHSAQLHSNYFVCMFYCLQQEFSTDFALQASTSRFYLRVTSLGPLTIAMTFVWPISR